jgi:tripartite-type tricarboxylate transporter receptor subunit TctC
MNGMDSVLRRMCEGLALRGLGRIGGLRRLLTVLAFVALVFAAWQNTSEAASPADGYPARPVKVLIPFAPGGGVDIMGRLLSQKLAETFGKNFYVENVGGAGGNIGVAKAANAPADGYTLLMTSSSFVVNPTLHKKIPYDPYKDFAPVTIAAAAPNVVVVNPNDSAKTLQQLIAEIRSNPGKYSFASSGTGTTPHLSGELFRLSFNLDMVHVPFTGAGPSLEATVGGHTPIAFSSLPAAVPLVKGGALRALAVTSAERVKTLPDVPTMAEAGAPGEEAETLLFVLFPAATPKEIVTAVHDAIGKIVQMPDIEKRFDTLGFRPMALTPEESAARIRSEIALWAKVIHDANIHQQ